MIDCPKCGGKFSLPTYRREHALEYLEYVCRTCGYVDHQPTQDSKEKHFPSGIHMIGRDRDE